MQRPEVRLIQSQQVESEREVTGSEAEEILRKYGYGNQKFSSIPSIENQTQKKSLTFEEMVKQEEDKRRNEQLTRNQKLTGPKPITFNSQNGYDSEVKWTSDEDSGLGFRIEITSDMKIPK